MGKMDIKQIMSLYLTPELQAEIEKDNRLIEQMNSMNLKLAELKEKKANGLISDEDEQFELGKLHIQLEKIERELKSKLTD